MNRLCFVVALVVAFIAPAAMAHESRPAYLEIQQTSSDRFDLAWKVPARGDLRLGLYVRMPAGCEIVTEPRGMFAGGAFVERWSVWHPDALVGTTIHIDGLRTTRTDVLVRIERLDGTSLIARLTPSKPSFVVEGSASVWRVARTYLGLGAEHILSGVDHLLFVLALLLLVKTWRRVIGTITAFTVAHSITLGLATLGYVRVPGPPVEAVIALSIVFVAAEILRDKQGRAGLSSRWPWVVAFTFGLLHGLGFAGALHEIGLPAHAIPESLLFFNLGVEFGQLAFIGVVAVAAMIVRRIPIRKFSGMELIGPYVIGSIAMLWVIERVAAF